MILYDAKLALSINEILYIVVMIVNILNLPVLQAQFGHSVEG